MSLLTTVIKRFISKFKELNFNTLSINLIKYKLKIGLLLLLILLPKFLEKFDKEIKISNFLKEILKDNYGYGFLNLTPFLFFGLFLIVFTHRIFVLRYQLYFKELYFYLGLIIILVKIQNIGDYQPFQMWFIGLYCLITLLVLYILGGYWNRNWPIRDNDTTNFFVEDFGEIDYRETIHEKFKEKIIKSFFSDEYQNSFSIGIIGSWGSGKTSFMKYLKSELENELKNTKVISKRSSDQFKILEFSPFLNYSKDNIAKEFFTQVSNQIKSNSSGVQELFDNYTSELLNLTDNKFLKGLFEINKQSVSETYEELKRVIKGLDLKVIIFIDDLDRLNSEEIIEILKLIRNTSDFANFIFVVALDKEYVVRILQSSNAEQNRNFIDKFFQLECFLPQIRKEDLAKAIIFGLKNSDLY